MSYTLDNILSCLYYLARYNMLLFTINFCILEFLMRLVTARFLSSADSDPASSLLSHRTRVFVRTFRDFLFTRLDCFVELFRPSVAIVCWSIKAHYTTLQVHYFVIVVNRQTPHIVYYIITIIIYWVHRILYSPIYYLPSQNRYVGFHLCVIYYCATVRVKMSRQMLTKYKTLLYL